MFSTKQTRFIMYKSATVSIESVKMATRLTSNEALKIGISVNAAVFLLNMYTVSCLPRYTIVMVFYALSLVFMLLLRPWLSAKFVQEKGTASIYAALYFFPLLTIGQAILGGILCKCV